MDACCTAAQECSGSVGTCPPPGSSASAGSGQPSTESTAYTIRRRRVEMKPGAAPRTPARQGVDEGAVAVGPPARGSRDGARGEHPVELVRGLLVAAQIGQEAVPGGGVRAGPRHQGEGERRLQHPALALLPYRTVVVGFCR
ncbi:hypothetical protein GCM10017687_88080 [Streptomyces echinatus]|uniref:hypothetical protein n=1 Tax=Streptomyces echinatus TaxID=67293 RepID=UPI0031EB95F0